jgi:hypothetical protein
MNLLNKVSWAEQIGFSGTWRSAALVNASNSTLHAKNNSTPCEGLGILSMPDQYSRDICN